VVPCSSKENFFCWSGCNFSQLLIYPGRFGFTVVQCIGLRCEHRSWEKISSLVAAMGSSGAARNDSPRAFRMFSSKECWSLCPQRLLMPSEPLAVLVVVSRGRVVVIPHCEVHVGTSAWGTKTIAGVILPTFYAGLPPQKVDSAVGRAAGGGPRATQSTSSHAGYFYSRNRVPLTVFMYQYGYRLPTLLTV
jgi:hypothetical protein